MKKFKRRLSLTLRGSQTIDESLSELAEQMTIEENSSKDNGKHIFHFVENVRILSGPTQVSIAGVYFSFHSCRDFLTNLFLIYLTFHCPSSFNRLICYYILVCFALVLNCYRAIYQKLPKFIFLCHVQQGL